MRLRKAYSENPPTSVVGGVKFKRILRRVLRQNVSIRRWGAFKQTVGQIGIYVTFINTVMLSVTLYSTRWVQENVININFIGFMAVVFGVIGLLLLLAWKMDMPVNVLRLVEH